MRESTKATRATILQSAKEIFLECGYQEASMRKIAARAGITPGAIYKHFSGKEEMFGEIFAESGNKLMALSESMLDIDFSDSIPAYPSGLSSCWRTICSSSTCC